MLDAGRSALPELGPGRDRGRRRATASRTRRTCAPSCSRPAARLADSFDRVGRDEWDRTGFRSDGAAFTVATFARYLVHDPIHHLHDVTG